MNKNKWRLSGMSIAVLAAVLLWAVAFGATRAEAAVGDLRILSSTHRRRARSPFGVETTDRDIDARGFRIGDQMARRTTGPGDHRIVRAASNSKHRVVNPPGRHVLDSIDGMVNGIGRRHDRGL